MTKNLDLSLYFIADPSLCAGRDVVDVVMMAAKGGARLIQYRNKSAPMNDMLAEAAMLVELLRSLPPSPRPSPRRGEGVEEESPPPWGGGLGWGGKIPLIINDHIEVAFAAGADGVHLGQGDESPAEARTRLGPNAIIGQTAFTPEHMRAIDPAVIDYVGTGPFFPTQTDKGKPVLGAEKFAALAALSPVPVFGIGGITPENAAQVMAAGADGVAVMRAISEAPDPEAITAQIVKGSKAIPKLSSLRKQGS